MKDYKISVIIPVYNVENYLDKCIKSILKQTHNNLQIILVDDGSKDKSGEICDFYQKEDKRVLVIHKENGGLVSARKAGLQIADGEFVGFVDSDDYVDADYYEIMLQDILKYQVDFVHTGCIYEYGEQKIESCSFEDATYQLDRENAIELMCKRIWGSCEKDIILQGVCFELFKSEFVKKCYEKVPDEQSYGEDLLCFCACLLEGSSMYMHKLAKYHYVKRNDSLTNREKILMAVDYANLYLCLRKLFVSYGIYEEMHVVLEREYTKRIMGAIREIDEFSNMISWYIFDDVELLKGKKIIIYGAGKVGKDYYAQLSKYSSCNIVAWIDKSYEKYNFDYAKVEGIEMLKEIEYDVILVAVQNEIVALEIKEELVKEGISDNKILWKKPSYSI